MKGFAMRTSRKQRDTKSIVQRRAFLKVTASTAGVLAVPAFVRGANLNDKLNVAIIGCGGRGASNLQAIAAAGENIVALCDVNRTNLDAASDKYPQARKCTDFRKLYDFAGEFDAVVVSTCEHTHAFATLPALELGKHVYCEKPLTHSIYEARLIRQAAAKAKVATQMGTQIHAGDNYRRVVELIETGAIGPVREVHVWVSRAWGWQPNEEEAKRHGDIVLMQDRPATSERFLLGSTGTCGWGRRPSGRLTVSMCRARNGIAGGILATAPCPTSAAIGSICRSGRSS